MSTFLDVTLETYSLPHSSISDFIWTMCLFIILLVFKDCLLRFLSDKFCICDVPNKTNGLSQLCFLANFNSWVFETFANAFCLIVLSTVVISSQFCCQCMDRLWYTTDCCLLHYYRRNEHLLLANYFPLIVIAIIMIYGNCYLCFDPNHTIEDQNHVLVIWCVVGRLL